MLFERQCWWITGASSGIGEATDFPGIPEIMARAWAWKGYAKNLAADKRR